MRRVNWKNTRARGIRRDTRCEMNKLEAEYAQLLQLRFKAGEILWYRFESWRFRLGNNAFYKPDFNVMLPDRTIEIHEVKGHWEHDALLRIKMAAEQFPFIRFIAVTKQSKKEGDGWNYRHFEPFHTELTKGGI
jgi:hypothetical protein